MLWKFILKIQIILNFIKIDLPKYGSPHKKIKILIDMY